MQYNAVVHLILNGPKQFRFGSIQDRQAKPYDRALYNLNVKEKKYIVKFVYVQWNGMPYRGWYCVHCVEGPRCRAGCILVLALGALSVLGADRLDRGAVSHRRYFWAEGLM